MKSKFVLLALCGLATASVGAENAEPEEYMLRAGYPVAVELAQHVHSSYDETDEKVLFRVEYEVMADGVVVIPEGFTFYGEVGSSERAKNRGRGGRITVNTRRIDGLNGNPIGVRGVVDSEGDDKGAQQAQNFGLWGLLGKGEAAFILRGTAVEAITLNDQKLGPLTEAPKPPEAKGVFSGSVSPKKYAFSLSKSKSDLSNLVISHPGVSDLRIVQINDIFIPDAIQPISSDGKNAEFEGWDVARFTDDGDNVLVVQGGSGDNISEARIPLKVKIR